MTQKRIYLSPPHMTGLELRYVQDAFDKNWITTAGENIDAFEKNICLTSGSTNCAVLSSGTAAIHLALILCGVEKGDEVICSSFTFVASANPILYLGATPIFIDSEPSTWNMSPELLEMAIKERIKANKKPKAIILVHLYGQVAQLEKILGIANQYEIPVIEDAAESLGSRYKNQMTGTFGRFGIYSFNGNKIITTSGGGALLSEDRTSIEKAKFLSTQARDKEVHYQHAELGYNYRMSNVLAGIGIGQLEILDERIKKKRSIFEFYKSRLSVDSRFTFLEETSTTFSNRWLSTVIIKDKTPGYYREKMEKENIESRPLWKPLHLQPLFKDAHSYLDGTSEALFQKGLCLPSGTNMNEEDLERVVKTLLEK